MFETAISIFKGDSKFRTLKARVVGANQYYITWALTHDDADATTAIAQTAPLPQQPPPLCIL